MWNARVQTSTQDYRPYVRLLAGEGPNLCELCEISYTNSCCDKKFKLLTPVLIIGADSASKDPVLFIWDKFADCYKLKSNTSITIEKIDRKSVICQKVIFAVKNYQTADVLSKSLTEFDELLESGPLLVRKNDWFWWKPELFKSVAIVSSEPTNQGIINSSTSAAVTLVPDLLKYF